MKCNLRGWNGMHCNVVYCNVLFACLCVCDGCKPLQDREVWFSYYGFFNMQLTLAINGQLQCCLFLISPLQIGNCANDGVKVLKLKPSTSEFTICFNLYRHRDYWKRCINTVDGRWLKSCNISVLYTSQFVQDFSYYHVWWFLVRQP